MSKKLTNQLDKMENLYNFKKEKIGRKSVVFGMLIFMSFLFSNQLNAQCTAEAGTLDANVTPVQLAGSSVTISATQDTAPTVPTNYEVAYVLTSGATLIIEQLGATPSFDVTSAGDYTIHTLVAELSDPTDPNFLDASVIVPGTTTGGDVLGIVTAGGLCAALDVTGAPIVVEDNLSVDENELNNSVRIFPNPVVDNLNLTNSSGINIQSIYFYDVSGRIVKSMNINNNSLYLSFDISEFSTGVYFMILNSDIGQLKKQIIKN